MARNEETLQADSRETIRGAAHLTRRSFIKATTAATALAAASSLTASLRLRAIWPLRVKMLKLPIRSVAISCQASGRRRPAGTTAVVAA